MTNRDSQFWLTLPDGEYAVGIESVDYISKTKVKRKLKFLIEIPNLFYHCGVVCCR